MCRLPSTIVWSRCAAIVLSFSFLLAMTAIMPSIETKAASPVPDDTFGTIKGKLVWGGGTAPDPTVLVAKGKAATDPAVCAAGANLVDNSLLVDPTTKGVKNAFVFLVDPAGTNPDAEKAILKKAPKVVMDQKNCEYLPYAVALHKAQTLVFKSSDPIGHNVHFSPFANDPFNSSIPPNGEFEKTLKAEPRAIPVTCDIHPWMQGYVMVFDHPFYTVTAEDGSFEIKGVPAGAQHLVVWHKSGFVNTGARKGVALKVEAGKTTDAGEFKLDPAKIKKAKAKTK